MEHLIERNDAMHSPAALKPVTVQLDENRKQRLVEAIKDEISYITNYIPKIGIFGDSGNGKSSLGNALFGQNIFEVGDIEACTREPQEVFVGSANEKRGIKLLDVPGVGENQERHEEYMALYKSLLPELDLVIWTIKADSRNDLSALQAYEEVIASNDKAPPVLFVLTQAEKISPIKEWDDEKGSPGDSQKANLNEKIISVSSKFNVPASHIIEVSADEGYNLVALVDLMVQVLPNEKKYSLTREAKDENVSEQASEQAAEGFMARLKKIAGEGWDWIKDEGLDLFFSAAEVLLPRVSRKVTQFFRSIF